MLEDVPVFGNEEVVKPDGVVSASVLNRNNMILDWHCPECSTIYGAIQNRMYNRDDRHFHRVCHPCAYAYAHMSYYKW